MQTTLQLLVHAARIHLDTKDHIPPVHRCVVWLRKRFRAQSASHWFRLPQVGKWSDICLRAVAVAVAVAAAGCCCR